MPKTFWLCIGFIVTLFIMICVDGCTPYAHGQESTPPACKTPGVTHYEDADGEIIMCPGSFQDAHDPVLVGDDAQCHEAYDFVFITVKNVEDNIRALNILLKEGWAVQGDTHWLYAGSTLLGIVTITKEVCE